MRIIRNSVRCKKCKSMLISERTKHFSMCGCGVWVDGGLSDPKFGWPRGEESDWVEDLRLYSDKPEPVILVPDALKIYDKKRDVLSKFFD